MENKITFVAYINDAESNEVNKLSILPDEEPVEIGEKFIDWVKKAFEAAGYSPRKIQQIRVFSKYYLEKEDRKPLAATVSSS